MSIEQYGDEYIPTCDRCGAELPPEYRFTEAVRSKVINSWQVLENGDGEWWDLCRKCYAAFEAFTANEEGQP